MKNKVTKALFLFLAAGMLVSGAAMADIRMGTLPRLNAQELEKMYAPLADYLSKETGEKVDLVIPRDFPAFKEAVKAGQMDIGFANPLIYVEVKERSKVEPLALSSEVKSGTRLRGIIIVRKDSGISTLQGLKGKKFVFMDKDSPAGYLFQVLLLSKAGFDTKKDIVLLPFAKRHDKVVASVLERTADAGGIREDELDKVKDTMDLSQIRIVGYTDYFPNWPFFATGKLKPETAAKVKAALLKLKPNDPRNDPILGPARLTGFIPVADTEYDDLRKAAKIAGGM